MRVPGRTVLSVLALAMLAIPASSKAGDTPTRTIDVDARAIKGPLSRMPLMCVGAGRAAEGLRADWQRQLAYVKKEIGFSYLRMHGLLGDDMGVYREDKDGRPEYNWQYIDEVYDFLVRIKVKPFVELGFMPGALASGAQTIFWWKGNVTKPKDAKKWADLVFALVSHFTERYGEDEVRTWYFEVWNEPNLDGFFAGTQKEYFELYANTARAIKRVSPHYRVGGPATAGYAWIPEFLAYCAEHKVPVDFASTHDYGTTAGFLDENGSSGTVLSHDPRSIWGNVLEMRKQIAASPFPSAELHFTEWSTSYTPNDPVHDSYHSAAFILDKLKKSGDAAQSMSYWVFSDIFEEAGPRFTPFHGGFGLLNYQDIRKPAFFAYQFLARLGPSELTSSDPASIAATDGKGAVQVLFWDFTVKNPEKGENNQTFYKRDQPADDKGTANVRVANLSPGRYAIALYRVGYRQNDAYSAYLDLGAPAQLTREQVLKINDASDGKPLYESELTVRGDGRLRVELKPRENDVFLILLRRQTGRTSKGQTL